MNLPHFVGIEGGGTKFVCAHGNDPKNLYDRIEIKTETPHITLPKIIEYIQTIQKKIKICGIGLAIFGPLDLDHQSPDYGSITTAPKKAWRSFNIVTAIKKAIDLPIGFDTDVNGAVISEHAWGAARTVNNFIYITIGTGIGGGAIVHGKILHGAMHPEMGHILIPQNTKLDTFKGVCPNHTNCLEGLASGTAMNARWQVESALEIPENHFAWDLEAHYLGIGIANYILSFSPERIIIGGGIMRQNHLLPKIRHEVIKALAGYVSCKKIIEDMDNYIIKPELQENAAVCGAFKLAEQAYFSSAATYQS